MITEWSLSLYVWQVVQQRGGVRIPIRQRKLPISPALKKFKGKKYKMQTCTVISTLRYITLNF